MYEIQLRRKLDRTRDELSEAKAEIARLTADCETWRKTFERIEIEAAKDKAEIARLQTVPTYIHNEGLALAALKGGRDANTDRSRDSRTYPDTPVAGSAADRTEIAQLRNENEQLKRCLAKGMEEATAAVIAALKPDTGKKPLKWECRDYGDGWIRFADLAEALEYYKETGAVMRPVLKPDTGE